MATALRTKRVLAIDLSRRSLAYAKRKANEMNRGYIEFAQADLTELKTLRERFDIVSSVGVLHHTHDMAESWRALRPLVQCGGLMHIGLYSRIARRHIAAAKATIERLGLDSTDDAIRRFRRIIREQYPEVHAALSSYIDFYVLGECRNLLFHRRETTHDLEAIALLLNEMSLQFLGFDIDQGVPERYLARFPKDAGLRSLDNWHRFETDNPDTFVFMHQFSVRALP